MLKKNACVIVFWASFLVAAFSHNPEANEPFRKFQVKNHQIFASFLMMKKDSVYLETQNGEVKSFHLSDFSKKNQRFFLEKMASIAQINQAIESLKTDQGIDNHSNFIPKEINWLWLLLCFTPLVVALHFMIKKQNWLIITAIGGITLVAFKTEGIQKILDTDPFFIDAAFQPFKPHVATHWDDNWFYVESNGLPSTHSMMTGIVSWQQQVPIPQCYTGTNAWQIPLHPVLAAQPVPVNNQHFLRGAIAIAANGIPIFNPFTNTGVDAFLDGQLDQWGGHSGRADDYHYHIAPMFLDTQSTDILPIAFALDGFAVYANQEPDGTPMLPLDANHGHFDGNGVYHYHGTPEAPYMIGNMVGQVTEDNTLQIIPQARAKPVRPSLTPLTGAVITNFQPNSNENGYVLTYTRNGGTFQVDYSWTSEGIYTYKFNSVMGTTTETYNGDAPCTSVVSTNDFFENTADIAIFPNPSTGIVYLKIVNAEGFATHGYLRGITIYDLSGRLVFQKENHGPELEIKGLDKGVYLVKIQCEKGEFSRKIIVQ